jgi:hypothetical protein
MKLSTDVLEKIHFAPGDRLRERAGLRVYEYRLASITSYLRKDGKQSAVLHWTGECAVCGVTFACTTGRAPSGLPRTCAAHRGALSYTPPRAPMERRLCVASQEGAQ